MSYSGRGKWWHGANVPHCANCGETVPDDSFYLFIDGDGAATVARRVCFSMRQTPPCAEEFAKASGLVAYAWATPAQAREGRQM